MAGRELCGDELAPVLGLAFLEVHDRAPELGPVAWRRAVLAEIESRRSAR